MPQLDDLAIGGLASHLEFNPLHGFATVSPVFPSLTTLNLLDCQCEARDLGAFLLRHGPTLEVLWSTHLQIDGDLAEVVAMFRVIAARMTVLRRIVMNDPCASDGVSINFPGVNSCWSAWEEDEAGFVRIEDRHGVDLEGREEVSQGSKLMLANLTF